MNSVSGMRFLRSAFRLVRFLAAASAWVLWHGLSRSGRSPAHRSRWAHACARSLLAGFGVELRVEGRPPAEGVVVSNHLGYLDIVVFAAAAPMVFVSKSEVARWPGIGFLARLSGTLFLERARRSDLARVAAEMRPVVEAGVPVVFYPEGTSTGGDRILPFHAGLFEPAASQGWKVTPAWIGYEMPEGSVAQEVCYWGTMTFLPHFLNLLSRTGIVATVRFGEPLPPSSDRKELAASAERAVRLLSRKDAAEGA